MTARINIPKDIPGTFIVEEVRTTTNKFEDILRCFNWFWSKWRNNILIFVLKWNFASPGIKIHQKHFRIKATPIWHFSAFINDPFWKAAWQQAKVLAPPKWASKGWYCDVHCWRHFAGITNCSLLFNIHVSNLIT